MPTMIFNDLYRKYLQHQAVNHPDLQHGVNGDLFQMISIEEALGDFRGQVKEKGYIMRGIHYFYNIGDDGTHEVRKHISAGFILAHYHSARAGGTDAFHEALRKSEKVGDEIIEKMIADSKAGHPLFNYSLNSRQQIDVQSVTNAGDGTYSGWRYIFKFSNYWRNCVTHDDAPAWADGGVTPHDL